MKALMVTVVVLALAVVFFPACNRDDDDDDSGGGSSDDDTLDDDLGDDDMIGDDDDDDTDLDDDDTGYDDIDDDDIDDDDDTGDDDLDDDDTGDDDVDDDDDTTPIEPAPPVLSNGGWEPETTILGNFPGYTEPIYYSTLTFDVCDVNNDLLPDGHLLVYRTGEPEPLYVVTWQTLHNLPANDLSHVGDCTHPTPVEVNVLFAPQSNPGVPGLYCLDLQGVDRNGHMGNRLNNLCVLHDPQGGDDDTADDDIFTEDFEDHPLGPLGSPWEELFQAGASTQTVIALKAGSGQVLLQQGGEGSNDYIGNMLTFTETFEDLRVDLDVWVDTAAEFGVRIYKYDIEYEDYITEVQLAYNDTTGLGAVDWSVSDYVFCGALTNETWEFISITIDFADSTFDVLINGAANDCDDLAMYWSDQNPIAAIGLIDWSDSGYGGTVMYDNLHGDYLD